MVPVLWKHSPNASDRPKGAVIDLIVLHADAGKTDAGTVGWIMREDAKVSYHYLIGRDGKVYQFVPEHRKAWHAGKSEWGARFNCNDYSIGVSFANNQTGEVFTEEQLAVGLDLVRDIMIRRDIPVARVVTHAQIAPGRKKDPGPLFPLATFLAALQP